MNGTTIAALFMVWAFGSGLYTLYLVLAFVFRHLAVV